MPPTCPEDRNGSLFPAELHATHRWRLPFPCTRARARSRTRRPTHALRKLCKSTGTKQSKKTGADGGCSTHRDEVRRQRGRDYFETSETRKNTQKTKCACAHAVITHRGAQCQQISACTTLHEQQPLTYTLGARTDDICVGPLTRYSRRPSLSSTERLACATTFCSNVAVHVRITTTLRKNLRKTFLFSFGLDLALTTALNATFWK